MANIADAAIRSVNRIQWGVRAQALTPHFCYMYKTNQKLHKFLI
jgi:hypothetical protein